MNDYELQHHGVKGMKWGVRRYQNEDGSLTELGKKRNGFVSTKKKGTDDSRFSEKHKAAIKVGATAVATALAAYGLYKLGKSGKLSKLASKGKDAVDDLLKKVAEKKKIDAIRKESLLDLKKVRTFSTDDLKKKIERLQMEKTFRELTESEVAPGKAFARDVITRSGSKIASTALSGAGIYTLKAMIDKKFDRDKFAESVYNGGPKKK